MAVDYTGGGTFTFGDLKSLDLSTNQVSGVAGLSIPPYLMRLAPPGDKLFLVEGHEVEGEGGADQLSVFDLTTKTLTRGVYFFSRNDLFVSDIRVSCPTGIPDWHWPPWPWPWAIPRRPLRGSGEGIWGFADPLWDPHFGLAANIGLGLGGPLGRRIAQAIDNWRRRFSRPEEPG